MSRAITYFGEVKGATGSSLNQTSSPRYVIARDTVSLNPLRLAIFARNAFFHLRQVREVFLLVSQVPALSEMMPVNARFAFKPFTGEYLAHGFTVPQCAECFLHHYRRLNSLLPEFLLRQLLQEEVTLHTFAEQAGRFALTLGLSRPYDNEGELTLRLRVDGDIVFVISFTIIEGSVVHSSAPEVLLISRLQGIKGCYRQIGQATRALKDVAPARLLLAALQGIADSLGIHAIVAVPAERQISYKRGADREFRQSYDRFFTELGLPIDDSGFFSSALPLVEKPITSVQRSHRSRTRRKRAFRLEVQSACASFLRIVLSGDRVKMPAQKCGPATVIPFPVTVSSPQDPAQKPGSIRPA